MIVVGIDAALTHMGLARAMINPLTQQITVTDLLLLCTEAKDGKTVRKSSNDLRRAQELYRGMNDFCRGASSAFAEVPSGSQSAVAARALGIAVGVLAGCCLPVIEVSQQEVKLASIGSKTATKDEMIAWAHGLYPGAPWKTKKAKGITSLTKDNEHLADACATISAGVRTAAFQQAIAMFKAHSLTQRTRLTTKGT